MARSARTNPGRGACTIDGVRRHRLESHPDDRGVFTELYRAEWRLGIEPVQWNWVSSLPETLRGVHVHARHDDYLTVVSGLASVGLRDLRAESRTYGLTAVLALSGNNPEAILIPHGVAHGFYFHEPSIHIYSVSHYWDIHDELGCRWDDPELEIEWPLEGRPRLSARDAAAPSLRELESSLASRQIGRR